jgi:hypothetical protein
LCQDIAAWHRAILFYPAHTTEEVVADLDRLVANLAFEARSYRSEGRQDVASQISAASVAVKDYRRELVAAGDDIEFPISLAQAAQAGDEAMAAIAVDCSSSGG